MLVKRWRVLLAAALLLPFLWGMTPVIDPGHGGFDGGAVAADGTVESGLNLAIARRLELTLLLFGVEPVLLRQGDEALGTGESIRSAKLADLRERAARTNAVPDGFLLSIHQNSYSSPRSHGAQVFWSGEESRALAEELQTFFQEIDPTDTRQAKPVPEHLYLFRQIRRPGLLVECGFLTNPEELARLKDERYQKRIACGIAGCFLKRYQ